MDEQSQTMALGRQGFFCSQILMLQGLALQGKENPELVRAMQGLAGGIGFTGGTCGALSGGACLLSLYAGKGSAEEDEDLRLLVMIGELNAWFQQRFGEQYGGIDCSTILGGKLGSQLTCCPPMIDETLQKVKELLVEHGFDLAGADFA
ncbi:MAG: C-GCAxxG-C-C family protein [Chloroflexaceae bacterium]|jgi:C_GCAxxG_C_C family probable redox protein|nr:C-GCAxxG-C-C family protein [Chloroflexaceae bacterium]